MRPILVQAFFVICMFCPLISMAEVRWAEREDGACAIHESRNSGYVDTPYVVRAPDGSWVSILTVGDGKEGSSSQHLQVFRSMDLCEWEHLSTLEPKGGPEASWGMPFLYEERLCVVYTYNTRNIRAWPLSDGRPRRSRDRSQTPLRMHTDLPDLARALSPERHPDRD